MTNFTELITNIINEYPENDPIFMKDIKQEVKIKIKSKEYNSIEKNLYVIINRLIKKNILTSYSNGIYYKSQEGTFGKKKLNLNKIIEKKYLKTKDNKTKGYISGSYLLNYLGFTTQVPNIIIIITNERPNKNIYIDKLCKVILKKPKIKITDENYQYLQLLDILENKDKINIETKKEKDLIYKYIKTNNLKMEDIFKYAKLTKNKKAIDKLYELA